MEFSVDLFEYQARDLFEKHGIPVLAAGIATTPEQAHDAAVKIGGKVVVKAQVKVGGRGKAAAAMISLAFEGVIPTFASTGILGDKDVKSVFVNVFGGITACDAVANGIVQALELLGSKATKPIVVRLDGNNVIEGRAILKAAAHPLIEQVDTMDGAANRAAELAAK